LERLQKVLARYGVASRRRCEELILAGRVRVNGKIVTQLGTKVDVERDFIEVDGKPLQREEEKVYIILYKPKGYLTTVRDPQGRKTVMDLVKGVKERIYPVGRLDCDTEGLLLLTNDGDLSFTLTHPSHRVEKTYLAVVKGTPSKAQLERLRRGVILEDGKTAPAGVRLLRPGRQAEVEITIHEGRKRQVRRMFDAIGHPVLYLRRVRFGPLKLEGLKPGQYRRLGDKEVRQLKKLEKSVFDFNGRRG